MPCRSWSPPARVTAACCAIRCPYRASCISATSGIELELRFWISDPQDGVNNVRSDVNRAIWRLFKEQNITIPVAQHEVRLRSPGPGPD